MNIFENRIFLPTTFLLIVSFIWFSKIFYIWDHDTGFWYLVSNNFDDDYIPYKNEFDNKGPLFFLFIKVLSTIIGYGVYQAYILYSLIIFLFFTVLLYLINQKKIDYKVFWILILSFTSIFLIKKPHIVFILFYYCFFLFFIHFLLISIQKRNNYYFLLSIFFFSLCSIVLVDIYLYTPLVLFAFVYLLLNKKKHVHKLLLYIILCLVIFFGINTLPQIYYGYDFTDFIRTNFFYNQTIKSEGPVKSLNFIYFLILTLILPLFIKAIYFSNIKKFIFNRFDIFILGLFILISILKYLLFSNGSGGRHILYLYIPLIYFIIYFAESIRINKFFLYFYFFLLIIVHTKNLAPPVFKNFIKHNCIINFYCDAPSYANLFKETVNYLKNNNDKKFYYVDVNPWILVISKSKYHGVINSYFIYSCKSGDCTDNLENNKPFLTNGLIESHKNFLSGKYGNNIIHDWLFIRNPKKQSVYWQEIVQNLETQKRLDHYFILKIKNN